MSPAPANTPANVPPARRTTAPDARATATRPAPRPGAPGGTVGRGQSAPPAPGRPTGPAGPAGPAPGKAPAGRPAPANGAARAPAGAGAAAQAPPATSAAPRAAPPGAQPPVPGGTAFTATRTTETRPPAFPPGPGGRPEPVMREEQRRLRIWQEEISDRQRALAEAPPEDRAKLTRQWVQEDLLVYRADPDDVEVETYPVRAPYAYVMVVRNKRTHELIYNAIEPMLTRKEKALLDFIETTLVDVIDLDPENVDIEELEPYIRGLFDQVLQDYSIRLGGSPGEGQEARDRLLYYVLRDFIGEGTIDVLMRDPLIEDISCDGPHQPVFVYQRKHEALTTSIRFRDHEHLDSFVIRLAQRCGKHISIAEPILDATMRDGSRLQATLAKEVSTFGSSFTIRKFRELPFTPVDLVRLGTMSPQMLAYMWLIIQYHMSAMYAGGTASGKTTTINALMLFIPPQHKVVTIEDTREIKIPQPNWIAGVTRTGFGPRDATGRQAGEIDMFQLLKNALRQRPEYIIVGEIRGEEAYSLFQAMATGHAAYGTMHADSVDAVIHRLESEPLNIPRPLLEALDVVSVQIQTRVGGRRVRRTRQVTELVGLDPNTREILTNEVFRWVPSTDSFEYSGVSYALERIAAEAGLSTPQVVAEMQDRVKVIQYMVNANVQEYDRIAQTIASYYKDKPSVMRMVDGGAAWP